MHRTFQLSRTSSISPDRPTPPELFYVRHGLTDWNAEMRFQGRRDIPLNEIGRAQAKRNGLALKPFAEKLAAFDFVCSPMLRTRETMEIIRAELGFDPSGYRIEERLIESAYGDLEGMTIMALKSNYRPIYDLRKRDRWNFQPPNGESLKMTLERIRPVIEELSQPTFMVAHGAVGRTVRKLMIELSIEEAGWFEFPQDQVFRFIDGKEELI